MLEYGGSYAYIDNQGYILEISANIKEGLAKITGYETAQDEIVPGNRLCENDLEKLTKTSEASYVNSHSVSFIYLCTSSWIPEFLPDSVACIVATIGIL